MNAFYEHHKDSIRVRLSVLRPAVAQWSDPTVSAAGTSDRFLQHLSPAVSSKPGRLARNRQPVHRSAILETPEERRDKFLDPYFRRAKPNQVVAIVKGREPARIMIAIGNKKENRWHLQFAQRAVHGVFPGDSEPYAQFRADRYCCDLTPCGEYPCTGPPTISCKPFTTSIPVPTRSPLDLTPA